MMREGKNYSPSWNFVVDDSTRRPCTLLHSPRKYELWPTSWSSISTRWGTWPFTSLVMSLILRERVKILSGLQVMQREDSISEQTMIRSKAHISGPSVGVSQIPWDDATEEGGDTEEEIKHFTLVTEDTTQPSSHACARAPDRLDHLIGRVEELHVMLASHISHFTSQCTYLEGQITTLLSQIDDMMRKSELEPKSDSKSDAI